MYLRLKLPNTLQHSKIKLFEQLQLKDYGHQFQKSTQAYMKKVSLNMANFKLVYGCLKETRHEEMPELQLYLGFFFLNCMHKEN